MNDQSDAAKDYVLHTAHEHNVKIIQLWFTDILGFLKSFSITVEELEDALKDGEIFDGSSIEGFIRHSEQDMIAMPDPSTFQISAVASGRQEERRRQHVLRYTGAR